jgi:hypothetical protein
MRKLQRVLREIAGPSGNLGRVIDRVVYGLEKTARHGRVYGSSAL